MTKIYTTIEIVSELKEVLDLSYDNELATYLGVSKQSMNQYKHKIHPDIQQKIISILLAELRNKDIES